MGWYFLAGDACSVKKLCRTFADPAKSLDLSRAQAVGQPLETWRILTG
jgi:hypothetical protein